MLSICGCLFFIMVSYGVLLVWETRSKIYKYLSFILVIVELILNGRYVMMTTYTNEAEVTQNMFQMNKIDRKN